MAEGPLLPFCYRGSRVGVAAPLVSATAQHTAPQDTDSGPGAASGRLASAHSTRWAALSSQTSGHGLGERGRHHVGGRASALKKWGNVSRCVRMETLFTKDQTTAEEVDLLRQPTACVVLKY